MRRASLLRSLGALALVVGLAACKVDTTVDVQVLADGTGAVRVTVTADHGVLVAEPNLAKELRTEDLTAAGWKVEGPTDTADGGLEVVASHTFADLTQANVLLRSLTGPSGAFAKPSLAAKGSGGSVRWTLTGRLDFSKGLAALADQQLLATLGGTPWASSLALNNVAAKDAASITFNVTLPGRATDAAFKPLPEPAPPFTWTVHPGDAAVSIDAHSSVVSEKVVKARKLQTKVALILGGYALVLAIAGAVWWNLRKRRPQAPQPPRRPRQPRRPRGPQRPPQQRGPQGPGPRGPQPPNQRGPQPSNQRGPQMPPGPARTAPQNGERRPPQGQAPHGR